jgi:hypothetical protein
MISPPHIAYVVAIEIRVAAREALRAAKKREKYKKEF